MPDDPRTEPASVKVKLTTGEGVEIEWQDGHRSHYTFAYLREQCPCAACRERRAKGQDVSPSKVVTPLPLYKEAARAVQAEAVGNYAVRFAFSDGHTTGIYSFDYFRRICPCAECRAHSESKPGSGEREG
jgi:DUF971 family protein